MWLILTCISLPFLKGFKNGAVQNLCNIHQQTLPCESFLRFKELKQQQEGNNIEARLPCLNIRLLRRDSAANNNRSIPGIIPATATVPAAAGNMGRTHSGDDPTNPLPVQNCIFPGILGIQSHSFASSNIILGNYLPTTHPFQSSQLTDHPFVRTCTGLHWHRQQQHRRQQQNQQWPRIKFLGCGGSPLKISEQQRTSTHRRNILVQQARIPLSVPTAPRSSALQKKRPSPKPATQNRPTPPWPHATKCNR